jgi:hypothetical protein
MAGFLPEDHARTIYGSPDSCTGGFAAPIGTARLVDGGQHVPGRHARHVVFGTPSPEQDDEGTTAGHVGIVGSRSVGEPSPGEQAS